MYKQVYSLDRAVSIYPCNYSAFDNSGINVYMNRLENVFPEEKPKKMYNLTNINYCNLVYSRQNYETVRRNINVFYDNTSSLFINHLSSLDFNNEEINDTGKYLFCLVTGKDLGNDAKINICSLEKFRNIQSEFGIIGENVQGFCINREKIIFVKKTDLGNTLITLGHELGHIFTNELRDKHNEEAKAFAFCIEWIKKIKERNILNLRDSLTLDISPARNGLHDVAFGFVLDSIDNGKNAMELYWEFAYGVLSLYS